MANPKSLSDADKQAIFLTEKFRLLEAVEQAQAAAFRGDDYDSWLYGTFPRKAPSPSVHQGTAVSPQALFPNRPPSWMYGSWDVADPPPKPKPTIDPAKIATLQKVEPKKIERVERVPDLIEPILAWRAWKVDSNSKFGIVLKAVGSDQLWVPRQALKAKCTSKKAHKAPVMDCNCGAWAFKSLEILLKAADTYKPQVIGQVALWGRVVETENGYRAEQAYPHELWLLEPGLEELSLVYDIPVRTL